MLSAQIFLHKQQKSNDKVMVTKIDTNTRPTAFKSQPNTYPMTGKLA